MSPKLAPRRICSRLRGGDMTADHALLDMHPPSVRNATDGHTRGHCEWQAAFFRLQKGSGPETAACSARGSLPVVLAMSIAFPESSSGAVVPPSGACKVATALLWSAASKGLQPKELVAAVASLRPAPGSCISAEPRALCSLCGGKEVRGELAAACGGMKGGCVVRL